MLAMARILLREALRAREGKKGTERTILGRRVELDI
jgi:hypothetical protein